MKKWNKNRVIDEANKLISKYGELPGANKLKKIGRDDFLMAVGRYYPGKMNKLRIDLDAPAPTKLSDYWTKEKIIEEISKIIKEEGKMPTQARLFELKQGTLVRYSYKYFGGLRNLAIHCGVHEDQLPTEIGYWKDIENVFKEMNVAIEKLGRFPTAQDLKLNKMHGLLNGITTYHCGINNIRKQMGFAKSCPIAKDGHFRDSYSEVIIDDFLYANKIEHRKIQLDIDNIKCQPDFFLNDNLLIEVLMSDYTKRGHTGIYKKYVQRYKKKRKAYLKNGFEVIEIFPQELVNRTKLDKKLTLIANRVKAPKPYVLKGSSTIKFFDKKIPGYWNDPKNLKKELMPLIEENGIIPPIKVLRKIGRSDIEGAIMNSYGSYRETARALGLDYSKYVKPQGYWKDINNIRAELESVIIKYGYLPGGAELKREGKKDVVAAIELNYNSFKEVANKLGLEYIPSKKAIGYWYNKDVLINEVAKVAERLGKFPNAKELRELKKHGIVEGILKIYGTFRTAAIEMGYDVPKTKPKGYWKDIINVYKELEIIEKRLGSIPPYKNLVKINSMLMWAIRNYHGGFKKLKREYLNFSK